MPHASAKIEEPQDVSETACLSGTAKDDEPPIVNDERVPVKLAWAVVSCVNRVEDKRTCQM